MCVVFCFLINLIDQILEHFSSFLPPQLQGRSEDLAWLELNRHQLEITFDPFEAVERVFVSQSLHTVLNCLQHTREGGEFLGGRVAFRVNVFIQSGEVRVDDGHYVVLEGVSVNEDLVDVGRLLVDPL